MVKNMTFNKGFLCPTCGPIEKSKKKTIKKVQYDTCPDCGNIVTPWERPLNERPGRCGNCGNAKFKLAMVKGHLLRCCQHCSEVFDVDANKVIRKGQRH
ncbi:hypothetical protein GBK2_53 [Geobacillus phage GBK2]|uniref:hypothetical protein n=1 Tax=Geobacillus phage GBK2 TaxID=1458842 RepID=UPI0003F1D2EB|nr:hypothetical protein GBK2_53 [Geobacillus phage GBK2]AHJ88651.1 hypothetical protein GBK2_53 [Geobacillus phage GBK2]